jgi:hypothetical protein
MKRQQIKYGTPRIGTKGISWLFWQRKAQTHKAHLILYKPKFKNEWSEEKQIQMLEDGIYVYSMALRYKDRGYHKFHRKCRKDAKARITKLAQGIG